MDDIVKLLPASENLQRIAVLSDVLKAAKDVFIQDRGDKDKLIKITVDKLMIELEKF